MPRKRLTEKDRYVIDGEEIWGIPIEYVVEPYPLQGRMSLAKKCPIVAAEWLYDKNNEFGPADFSYGSGVNAWWKCDQGPDHIWRQRICIRAQDHGCPYCAGLRASVTNSLAALYPEIAKEWHSTLNTCKPTEVTHGMTEAVFWQCQKNKKHVWQATINDRTSSGTGCRICRDERVEGLRDFPKALKCFDREKNKGIDPLKLPIGKKVFWRCPTASDHVWFGAFWKERANEPCPYCRGKRASSTNNLTLRQDLMPEFDAKKNGKVDPFKITLGSDVKIWWRCSKCKHSWKAAVETRTRKGYGCPACAVDRRRATMLQSAR